MLTVMAKNTDNVKDIIHKYAPDLAVETAPDDEQYFTCKCTLPVLPLETVSELFADLEEAEKQENVASFGVRIVHACHHHATGCRDYIRIRVLKDNTVISERV